MTVHGAEETTFSKLGQTMISGIATNGRLRCLRSTLSGWIELNRKLGRGWSHFNDVPWWYNERALLSLFVGAVWKGGGEAFEEFSELKRSGKDRRSGRIDLWFSKAGHDFWAEAKQCEIPITKTARQIEGVTKKMHAAKADVGRCAPDGRTRRLAIVFGAPYLRPCERQCMEERLEWFLGVAHDVEHDAIAWVFPTLKRQAVVRNWISPGSIVWIKEVRRSAA